MSPFLVLLFIIPGSIMLFLGKYIGKTQYVEVLKQYNDKKTYDRPALAAYVKKLMMVTGAITVTFSLISIILSLFIKDVDFVYYYLVLYAIITIHYIIKLRFSCKKFEIKETL